MKRLAFVLGLVLAAGCGSSAERLNGGGSTFINPLMSKWISAYEKEKSVQINYQPVGSGSGVTKLVEKEFDFGCTDAPMNEEQLGKARASGGEVVHIPLTLGAVVPAYNLEGVEDLQLTGPILADIFLRKIKRWDDPQIKKVNEKIADKLPAKDIVVVRRSDGSGTTYIFADYLSKVSPEWKKEMGVSTALKWPKDTTGERGNDGVANGVKLNPGAIGYIELTYALNEHIPFAAVQNAAGEFLAASFDGVTTAANNTLDKVPEDLRYSYTNAPGKGSYPIGGTVWAVLYVQQPAGTGQKVVEFIRWVTRADGGQKYAAEQHYVPLPAGLIERIDKALGTVKVGG